MMKKNYSVPEIDIEFFETEDVLTMLLGFFLLCYALENNDPAPTFPLGVTARQFSACSNLNGIASRLLYSYLTYSIKS